MDMGQDSLKEPANPGTWGSSLNLTQTNTPQGWNRKDQLPSQRSVSLEGSLTCRCWEPGPRSQVLRATVILAQTSNGLLIPSGAHSTGGSVGRGCKPEDPHKLRRRELTLQSCHLTNTRIAWNTRTYTMHIHNKKHPNLLTFLLDNFLHTTAMTTAPRRTRPAVTPTVGSMC